MLAGHDNRSTRPKFIEFCKQIAHFNVHANGCFYAMIYGNFVCSTHVYLCIHFVPFRKEEKEEKEKFCCVLMMELAVESAMSLFRQKPAKVGEVKEYCVPSGRPVRPLTSLSTH